MEEEPQVERNVPGKEPAVCDSLVELLDLYPTTARLCGLDVPERLQGKDISLKASGKIQAKASSTVTVKGSAVKLN